MNILYKAGRDGKHYLYQWLVGQKATTQEAQQFVVCLHGAEIYKTIRVGNRFVPETNIEKFQDLCKKCTYPVFRKYNKIRWHDLFDTVAKLKAYMPVFKKIINKYPDW